MNAWSQHAPVPRIARFEVISELGRGAFGLVLRARDPQRGREVAIKLLLSQSERAAARFAREIETTLSLRHPNLVAVLESGVFEGRPFLVMDFVRGETLGDLVGRPRGLSPSRACELMRDAARGIAYAHEQGVLHRDLKPANILVDASGSPRVLDFGLAFLSQSSEQRLSQEGAALGTPGYMAPEQGVGKAPTEQTDVYGLAATLYYTLAKRSAFADEAQPLLAVHRVDPRPPSTHNPAVPPELDEIVLRGMSRDPEQRQASAEAFALELQAFLSGEGQGPRKRSVGVAWPALALALSALLVGGAWVAWQSSRPVEGPSESPTDSRVAAAEGKAAYERFLRLLAEDLNSADLRGELAELSKAGCSEEALASADAAIRCIKSLESALARSAARAESAEVYREFARATELARAEPALQARVQIEIARFALKRNDKETLSRARAALEQTKHAREAEYLWGALLVRGGPTAAAREVLARVIQGDPDDRVGMLARADVAILDNLDQECRTIVGRLLSRFPRDPMARLLALRARRTGSAEHVRRGYDRLILEPRVTDDAFVWLAYAAFSLGNGVEPERVADYVQRAVELCAPRDPPRIAYLRGLLAMQEPDYARAAEHFRQAVLDTPGRILPRMLLGSALDSKGEWDAAEEAWRSALELDHGGVIAILEGLSPGQLRLRACRTLGLGRLPRLEAPRDLKQLLRRYALDSPAGARGHLISALRKTFDGSPWSEIEPHFNAALAKAPGDLDVLHHRALSLGSRGRFKEAAKDFAFLRKKGLKSPSLPLDEAENAYHARDFDLFQARMSELKAQKPRTSITYSALAFDHWVNSRPTEAIAAADQALESEAAVLALTIKAVALRELRRGTESLEIVERSFKRLGYLCRWAAQVRADMILNLAFVQKNPTESEQRQAEARGFREQLAMACVAPSVSLPYQRYLEYSVLLPKDDPHFLPSLQVLRWHLDVLKQNPERRSLRASRILMGTLQARTGLSREAVLDTWRTSPGGDPLEIPAIYRAVFEERFGPLPDLSAPAATGAPKGEDPPKKKTP